MSDTTDRATPRPRFFALPGSWVGWTSVALAILSIAAVFNRRLTGGFRGVFAGWVVAGVFALVAIVWKKERSVLVWIPLVIGTLAAVWGGAEILFPH